MNSIEATPRLTTIIERMFDVPGDSISRTTTAQDVEGWDSLTHIDLIVAVEREFKVRFTTAEVVSLQNVGELIDLVAKKTA